MGKEYLEQPWFVLARQTSQYFICFLLFFIIFPTHAQVSAFEKAEAAFYNKDFQLASENYKNVITNEYSLKKDVAISKCRLVLINNNTLSMNNSLKYLEESLLDDLLPSAMNSICSYALIQVYFINKDFLKALALVKKMGSPHLQPIYLARLYALAAESARFSLNKDLEKNYLNLLQNIMKKNNYQTVELSKVNNNGLSFIDVEARLSVLNFENNMENNFQSNFIESVLLAKIKDGDFQQALEILEKNIIKNQDSILINSGISISNDQIRARLLRLESDSPQEMRIGILLPNIKDRQKNNQNVLRAVSVFLASPAANGVKYQFYVEECNIDEGSLSTAAAKLIFDNYVQALIIPEGFHNKNDLNYLSQMFAIPVIYSEQNLIYNSTYNNFNSIQLISANGKFRDFFEDILSKDRNSEKIEEKIFDALILLRNAQYLANSSQNTELEKVIRSGHWKIEGVSAYEGKTN